MVGINYNSICPVCGHKMLTHVFKEISDEGHSVVKQEGNVITLSEDSDIFIRKVIFCAVPECEQTKELGYCYLEGC